VRAVIRVLLVGEVWAVRQDAVTILANQADLQLVGELPFGDDMPVQAAELWPRVVVFNTEYMVSQVLPAVAELKARVAGCSALMLADPRKPGMLPPRRPARGLSFLTRDAGCWLLVDTVRRVASGERVVGARLQVASLSLDKQVNTRELEVLGLAAEGKRAAEIAQRLYLSGGTVRNYLSAAVAKTGARNLIDAIRILREEGWLR
jgi:two-component system response regulator DesR